MAQQPKAAAATSTTTLTRVHSMVKYIPASTNLYDARTSWPIPPYMDEVPMPTSVKTEIAKEKAPSNQAAIPHTLIKPQNSKPTEQECRWGPQCPVCTQATPNIKTEDTRGRLEWQQTKK